MGQTERAPLTPASALRLKQFVPAAMGLVLFLASIVVIRAELRAVGWHELLADVLLQPRSRLALALFLTALNYAVLTGYDFLALASIERRLPRWRVAIVSFLAYAVATNVGFAILAGASVRYRFYTRWGMTTADLTRIVFSYSVTFWLGLLALGGLSLALGPLPVADGMPSRALLTPVGWLLVLASGAYVAAAATRRKPVRVGRFELALPSPSLALAQLLVSLLDWTLAAAALFAMLPPSALSFAGFAGMFLAAMLIGFATGVPGGVGVFEGLLMLFLKPYLSPAQVVPALVAYRAIFFLLPLTLAMIGLAADELRQRRNQVLRMGTGLGDLAARLTPRLLSTLTFLGGVLLLVSGATPAAAGRLTVLERVFPLAVIEVSHFVGSIIGVALLVLSQGLWRRLDAAYFLTTMGITIGIAASLLKGVDYEEAALLAVLLLVLWRARPAFDRRAAFFETRFSARWIAAVVSAVGATAWLGLFAFRHVEYSSELWWQFELHAEASRFLRASVGTAIVLLVFATARLIRRPSHQVVGPDAADLEAAGAIITKQPSTAANLVYLRDKAVLFDEERKSFVMYGVQGRSWVVLGDPVGPPGRMRHVIRLFLERCNDFDGVPVFYEVRPEHLHRYADVGLTFVKLGEEARVDLTEFTLDGGKASKLRQIVRRLEKDGGAFRIIPARDVPGVLPQLRDVSNDWLHRKSGAEKGFSLGFFDTDYLSHFPVAVIERGGRIQAFANLWLDANGDNISLDLMRYHQDAPRDVMEALFVNAMKWGKDCGYRSFALGMAPLSGFEASPVATLWTRLGSFLYDHGEALYNFQGLRAYKNKFNPVWEPRYLAYPGGLRLPRILADVSALIAGGYRNIFTK
jgi:phosphatidylglycerol lysyltransferase